MFTASCSSFSSRSWQSFNSTSRLKITERDAPTSFRSCASLFFVSASSFVSFKAADSKVPGCQEGGGATAGVDIVVTKAGLSMETVGRDGMEVEREGDRVVDLPVSCEAEEITDVDIIGELVVADTVFSMAELMS